MIWTDMDTPLRNHPLKLKTRWMSSLTATAVVFLSFALLLGCEGTLEVDLCEDGDEDGDLICEDGQWVVAVTSCDDVDCGEGGICVESEDEIQCSCDQGFEAQGLECVPTDTCQSEDCGVYVLAGAAGAYERTDYLSTDLGDELDGPIVAAFNLEDTNRAYVLTQSNFLRIQTTDFSVQATGPLSQIHPDLSSGSPLQAAYALPERLDPELSVGQGNDTITFLRKPNTVTHGEALLLVYDFDTATFSEGEVYSGWNTFDWSQNNPAYEAHVPSMAFDFLAMWFDDQNQHGLAPQADFDDACPESAAGSASAFPYVGVLTSEPQAHYQATDVCFPFLAPDLALFDDFDDAPTPQHVGAGFWHDGALYLFGAGFY